MVRFEAEGVDDEPAMDIWFSERAEMDDFLARRPKGLMVTDIHERGTNSAETALASAAEYLEDAARPFELRYRGGAQS